MKEVAATDVSGLVARIYQDANFFLPDDVIAALEAAAVEEDSPAGREVLATLLENAAIAARERVPLCQDTGIAVVFVEMGQDLRLVGGTLAEAVDAGIRQAVADGYLRASVVADPLNERINTGDNTPAMLHTDIVAGESIRISVMPKGAGSENMSSVAMLKPHDGAAGLVDFAVAAVERAGASACPPLFLGVGVGGTIDQAALLSKKALLRPAGVPSPVAEIAAVENELVERVNALGIGPAGFGGTITCLGAAVEQLPCHIASLPVAVNLQCNSARRAVGEL